MRTGPRTTDRTPPGMLMIGLLALWAFVVGGTAIRVHDHAHPAIVAATSGITTVATTEGDCALCDAAAGFEPFMPTAPFHLAPTPAPRPIAAPHRHRPATPVSRAHIWRSRAPPEPVSLP